MVAYEPEKHHRRSIRLPGYDYAGEAAYFVTLCTESCVCFFGAIVAGEMVLNDAGRMVETVWNELPLRFDHMELDAFVVMPNHFHAVFILNRLGECLDEYSRGEYQGDSGRGNPGRGDPCDRPLGGGYNQGEYKIRPYKNVVGLSVGKSPGDGVVRRDKNVVGSSVGKSPDDPGRGDPCDRPLGGGYNQGEYKIRPYKNVVGSRLANPPTMAW
jgi:hypothetical protein